MRKIQITKAQLNRLTEIYNQGSGVNVAAKTDSNGKVTQTSLEQQNRELDTQGLNNAKIVVSQETLGENKYDMFTKKQLKEARLAKLMAVSKKYKKSEL